MDTKDIIKELDLPEGYELEVVEENRAFYMLDEITPETVREFSNWKESLSEFDSPVYLYINSPGGCANSMIAIIALMEDFKEIHGHVLASAYSAALGIFAKCHYRSMYEYSEVMYHLALYETSGNINDHKEQLKISLRLQDTYEKIIMSGSNLTKKGFKKDRDWYLNREECIKIGLVNVI